MESLASVLMRGSGQVLLNLSLLLHPQEREALHPAQSAQGPGEKGCKDLDPEKDRPVYPRPGPQKLPECCWFQRLPKHETRSCRIF